MGRVAVAQMASTANLSENLQIIKALFAEAKANQADVLVLPENFALMGMTAFDKLHVAEDFGQGLIQETLSELALQHQLWVVGGTIPIKAPDERVFASSLVFNAVGDVVARYDKMHLFDVLINNTETHAESDTIVPGKTHVVVETPVGRIGLSVCYDVRFPELYRALLDEGAELFTVVSAFTKATGQAHWHTLLKSRAIENVAYVLGANQTGLHANGRETYGHSVVINPWGEVLADRASGTGLIYAEIDLNELHNRRAAFPCVSHRVL